jgi:hypothetical protein
MKDLIAVAIVGALMWYGYTRYEASHAQLATEQRIPEAPRTTPPPVAPAAVAINAAQFKCDGRTHCSQMTSCAEATFFLQTCPGVKMDGNNDGVPCEQQWCQ